MIILYSTLCDIWHMRIYILCDNLAYDNLIFYVIISCMIILYLMWCEDYRYENFIFMWYDNFNEEL